MNSTDCICFKPARIEEELGLDEAIAFYKQQIENGSRELEHFERLVILLRHKNRIGDEIRILQKAVYVYERIVFEDHIQSALPILNRFTSRLTEAGRILTTQTSSPIITQLNCDS
jgi:hypothetical protein